MVKRVSRRKFLGNGVAMIGLSATAPAFLIRCAKALAAGNHTTTSSGDDRVLVVVQLAGGNDGLNTIIPVRMDQYYRARPNLAIKADEALLLTNEVGLNPSAQGLKELYDNGMLAIIQGAGYPNPNRSHFVSTDIWESADPNRRTFSGWVGRYFDNECGGGDPPDPQSAIALKQEIPLALVGDNFAPFSVVDPNRLRWREHHTNPNGEATFSKLLRCGMDDHTPDGKPRKLDTVDFLRRSALEAELGAEEIREAANNIGGVRKNFAGQLALVADMIASDLPTRVYYVSLGSFDTHANQKGRHAQLLKQLGDGLLQLTTVLKRKGLMDRVTIMTFSEFGRRVAQNASGGTDHGTAAPLFVVGNSINAGLQGKHPHLEKLDQGDLIHTTDFRCVYASVIEDWLGGNARQILSGKFRKLSLFA